MSGGWTLGFGFGFLGSAGGMKVSGEMGDQPWLDVLSLSLLGIVDGACDEADV